MHRGSEDLVPCPYHLEGAETLPGLFKVPSWRGKGRSGCPEELSPNGATSTSRAVGRQERRDLPAESGEGMKVRTLFAGAPCWPPPLTPVTPSLTQLERSYTLGYLVPRHVH